MKKKGLTLLFFCLSILTAQAQQQAMYGMYLFNNLTINPANAGIKNDLSATFVGRYQWLGLKGAPQTYMVSIDGAIKDKKIGLGLLMSTDQAGLLRQSGIHFNFAYQARYRSGIVSIGLKGGLDHLRFDAINAEPVVEIETFGDLADISTLLPNMGVGAKIEHDRFFVGFSMPDIFKNRYYKGSERLSVARQFLHYFATVGTRLNLGTHFKLQPSVLMKAVHGAPLQFDLNAIAGIPDLLWLGASYRTGDAYVFLAHFHVKKAFSVGYAFEQPFTKMRGAGFGTHEVLVRYSLGFDKTKIKNPRFF